MDKGSIGYRVLSNSNAEESMYGSQTSEISLTVKRETAQTYS